MISITQFIVELRNFSSAEKPITARAMFEKYGKQNEKLEDYQRMIAKYARELQADQLSQYSVGLSKPKGLIFSCNGGYYVARNRDEAIKGRSYYDKKLIDMFKNRRVMKKLIDKAFPESEQTNLF